MPSRPSVREPIREGLLDATCLRPDRQTGVERYALHMLQDVTPRMTGWRWTVLLRDDADVTAPPHVEVTRIRAQPRIWSEAWRLPAAMPTRHALLVCPAFPPPLLTPRSLRVVMTIHDATYWRYPELLSRGARAYYKPLLQHQLRRGRISAVLSPSEAAADDVRRVVGDGISVYGIPLGVEPRTGEPAAHTRERFLLAVGTVEPRKNYGTLIAAFERLLERGVRPPQLKIVGRQGWGSPPALSEALKPYVSFLGMVDDPTLHGLYRDCSGFLMPSLYEGFGLPLAEAMMHGCTCVASDLPALREVGRDAAFFVDPTSVDAWCDAILRLTSGSLGTLANPVARAAMLSWGRWADATAEALMTISR